MYFVIFSDIILHNILYYLQRYYTCSLRDFWRISCEMRVWHQYLNHSSCNSLWAPSTLTAIKLRRRENTFQKIKSVSKVSGLQYISISFPCRCVDESTMIFGVSCMSKAIVISAFMLWSALMFSVLRFFLYLICQIFICPSLIGINIDPSSAFHPQINVLYLYSPCIFGCVVFAYIVNVVYTTIFICSCSSWWGFLITRVGERIMEKSTGKPVTHTVEKMSKSKYNGIAPQVHEYLDTLQTTHSLTHITSNHLHPPVI